MRTEDAYNRWAETYDTVSNKTRDLEERVIREVLEGINCDHLIEIGCGTGKNTAWLVDHCNQLTAIDFSEQMLSLMRQKIANPKVLVQQADITKPWTLPPADLITCSLVLEHIADLEFIFGQAATHLNPGGQFYICELHPYKQLQGSRARFEENGSVLYLEYFVHHVSEYMEAAIKNHFNCISLREWFDNNNQSEAPRLVSYLFEKNI